MNALPFKIDKNLVIGVGGLALVGVALYLFFKKEVTDAGNAAIDAVGGVLSGNNRLTEGTVYEDRGIFGTLGAGANEVSGGALEGIGSWIGGKLYDITHSEENEAIGKTPGFSPRANQVRETASFFEQLIGK